MPFTPLRCLQLRPLDSASSETLTKTRSKFLHVKQTLDDVMAELDNQLELQYQHKKQQGRCVGAH